MQPRFINNFLNIFRHRQQRKELGNHIDLIYRTHSGPTQHILKNGLNSKGEMRNLKLHVQNNDAQSNYISTATNIWNAIYFGVGAHNLIVATKPHFSIDVEATPLVPKQKNGQQTKYVDPEGLPLSFGANETEFALPDHLAREDIFSIQKRLGFSYASVPYASYKNEHHSPAAVCVELLSACQEQAEEYEAALKKEGLLASDQRYIKPEEAKKLKFGRIPTDKLSEQKQLIVRTIPSDLPADLLEDFLAEKYKIANNSQVPLSNNKQITNKLNTPHVTISKNPATQQEIKVAIDFMKEAEAHWKSLEKNKMTFFQSKVAEAEKEISEKIPSLRKGK